MKVIAVDPGITTGIATFIDDKYGSLELTPYMGVWDFLEQPWDLVICENFTAEQISKYGVTTIRIIGGIEAICYRRKIPLQFHRNVDRLPYIARAKKLLLDLHGMRLPRDHRIDSMAHLLRWHTLNG